MIMTLAKDILDTHEKIADLEQMKSFLVDAETNTIQFQWQEYGLHLIEVKLNHDGTVTETADGDWETNHANINDYLESLEALFGWEDDS